MKNFIAKKPRELSTVKNPCQVVWDICNANPTASRKQLLDACVSAGICFGTASTQQARWRKQTKHKITKSMENKQIMNKHKGEE